MLHLVLFHENSHISILFSFSSFLPKYNCDYLHFQLTTHLVVLIAITASTSYAVPIETIEDSSLNHGNDPSIGFLAYPTDTDVAYWDDINEEERWNEIQQVDEPRQLSKRSPKIKKKAKKLLKKFVKFSAGSTALSSLPSLPSLGAIGLVGGGAGAGAGGLAAVFGPPAAAALSRTFG